MDEAGVERLVGLCRLWGAARWFHPDLAGADALWDHALVETVPKVLACTTAADYRAAIEHLLSFLGDDATTVIGDEPPAWLVTLLAGPAGADDEPEPDRTPQVSWIEDAEIGRVAVLVLGDLLRTAAGDLTRTWAELTEACRGADAVLLDCREAPPPLDWTSLFSGDLALPTSRHRVHSGWSPDAFGSARYYSGFTTKDVVVLRGRPGPLAGRRLAFITGAAYLYRLGAIIGGLAERGDAVHVATESQQGYESSTVEVADGVVVNLATEQPLTPGGAVGPSPHWLYAAEAGAGEAALHRAVDVLAGRAGMSVSASEIASPARRMPPSYDDSAFPDVALRVLALCRHWNVIRYHFAYRHLLDRPWVEELREFVPRVVQATDEIAYALAMAEYNARIRDTHGGFRSAVFDRWIGTHQPPILVRQIEGLTVVCQVADDTVGVTVGDVVTSINGEPIGARRERLIPYLAASTPQSLERRLDREVLKGPEGSAASLRVRHIDGTVDDVKVSRTVTAVESMARPQPVFGVLPEGIGYVDLVRLLPADVDAALAAVGAAPAVIFDMRGYPNATAWQIGYRLAKRPFVAAQFSRPEPRQPDEDLDSSVMGSAQRFDASGDTPYAGDVVVLIDESAVSMAEHTCLMFEGATEGRVRFVGTPTAGANGDVTSVSVPGGMTMMFSGHDVRHADGRQLQRVGIQPDLWVAPTIAGIAAGRDEVLETALDLLAAPST